MTKSNIRRESKIRTNEAYDLYREESVMSQDGFPDIKEEFGKFSPKAIKAQEDAMWNAYLAEKKGIHRNGRSLGEFLADNYEFWWKWYCDGIIGSEEYYMSDAEEKLERKAIEDFLYGENEQDEELADEEKEKCKNSKSNRRRSEARAKKHLTDNARIADNNMNVRKENDSMKYTFCKKGAGHWIISPKKELMRALELVKRAGKVSKKEK